MTSDAGHRGSASAWRALMVQAGRQAANIEDLDAWEDERYTDCCRDVDQLVASHLHRPGKLRRVLESAGAPLPHAAGCTYCGLRIMSALDNQDAQFHEQTLDRIRGRVRGGAVARELAADLQASVLPRGAGLLSGLLDGWDPTELEPVQVDVVGRIGHWFFAMTERTREFLQQPLQEAPAFLGPGPTPAAPHYGRELSLEEGVRCRLALRSPDEHGELRLDLDVIEDKTKTIVDAGVVLTAVPPPMMGDTGEERQLQAGEDGAWRLPPGEYRIEITGPSGKVHTQPLQIQMKREPETD